MCPKCLKIFSPVMRFKWHLQNLLPKANINLNYQVSRIILSLKFHPHSNFQDMFFFIYILLFIKLYPSVQTLHMDLFSCISISLQKLFSSFIFFYLINWMLVISLFFYVGYEGTIIVVCWVSRRYLIGITYQVLLIRIKIRVPSFRFSTST